MPGSQELMGNNVLGLVDHVTTIGAKHGRVARSQTLPLVACDKIEYAETGAAHECRNLAAGGHGTGLSKDELRRVQRADHPGLGAQDGPASSHT